jgi:large subunit ribosomal protein L24
LTSTKPKVQRKMNASLDRRVRMMRAPLSKDLSTQYGFKTAPLRKGDTVLVSRGDYKGHEGKVGSLIIPKMRITVEGVNIKKMDGTNKLVQISPSKVTITKLDLSDNRRKQLFESKSKK